MASGRGGLANMFPRLAAHSPYSTPQRLGIGGLYRGVAYPQPLGIDVPITPGHGEFLIAPLYSFDRLSSTARLGDRVTSRAVITY